MITTQGQIINIDGTTEWLLFNRLSRKVNPVDFLSLTDSTTQLPYFFYAVSFLLLIFTGYDTEIKLIVPVLLYIVGVIMISFQVWNGILKLLKLPLLYFTKLNTIVMAVILASGFYCLHWLGLIIFPLYFLTVKVSIFAVTQREKIYYKLEKNLSPANSQIFVNCAFLFVYRYYAIENNLIISTSPTAEETANKDWEKPYRFLREHWNEIESHFNNKAKTFWRMYLCLDK
jgi:hypothetical protein